MNIIELEKKIIDASQAYYEGNPIMSDKQFDDLLVYLKSANPNSDIFNKVGWGFDPYKSIGEKENHLYGKVIGIDNKPRTIDKVPNNFKNENITLSAKLDGLSMVCYFVDGKFTKALTRGNGITGINRTDKIQKILEKELNIPDGFDFTGAIRGEVCISNDNWKIMEEKGFAGSSQRNTAVGILNRDEILEDINFVDLLFYKVIGYNDNNSTYNNIYKSSIINDGRNDFKFLRKFVKKEYLADYIEDNGSYINQNNLEELYKRFNSKYKCDGIVITSDYRTTSKITNNKYLNNVIVENNEVAYKFEGDKAITKIIGIRWKMSKGNKAIPVINVEPVELSDATVQNATAYNAKYIYDNDLDVGSEVEIIRSGEVIPYITNVISNSNGEGRKKLDEMHCPFCDSKLEWDGVDLVCKNEECSNRDEQNLRIWVNSLGVVDGMSETLNFKFFNELNINSLEELYNKSYDELAFKEVTLNSHKGKFNLVLDKLFNQSIKFIDLLVGLNIKMLGIKNAEKLSKNDEFISWIKNCINTESININDIDTLSNICKNLIGVAFSEIIVSNDSLNKLKNILYVSNRIDFSHEEVKELIPVVITGKLSIPRKEFEKFLNENGYEVKGGITKDVKYLITDNPNSSSSKNVKATELGIEKITEEQIRKIINEV